MSKGKAVAINLTPTESPREDFHTSDCIEVAPSSDTENWECDDSSSDNSNEERDIEPCRVGFMSPQPYDGEGEKHKEEQRQSESQQQTRQPSAASLHSRPPSVMLPCIIDLTGEDDSPPPMDSNKSIAGPYADTSKISEPDAARTRKRQRKTSCNGNASKEEPRKRMRQATCAKSRSKLESPLPRVESDIVGVTEPRPAQTRFRSREWHVSHRDDTDSAAVLEDIPIRSHRPPPPHSGEPGLHGLESPNTVIQSLKACNTATEKERDEYRESYRKVATIVEAQGGEILLLQTKVEQYAEENREYKRQLSKQNGRIKQLRGVAAQPQASRPEGQNDQELHTTQNKSLGEAIDESAQVDEGLLDEGCIPSDQEVQVDNRRQPATKDLAGLRGSAEEQDSRSQRAEPEMEQKFPSKPSEEMVASAVHNEKVDSPRAAKAKLEQATASLHHENKQLKKRVASSEYEVSRLRDNNQQLNAELLAKRYFQDQLDVVIATLNKTNDDGVTKENRLKERVAILEADVAKLGSEKLLLEEEASKVKEDMGRKEKVLEEKVSMLQADISQLEDQGMGKKEQLQGLLHTADIKIELLTTSAERVAEENKTVLQEARAKHNKELQCLQAIVDSTAQAADAAAKSSDVKIENLTTTNRKSEVAFQVERVRFTEHTQTLEAEVDKSNSALNAKTEETKRLQSDVRDLEAKTESLKVQNRDQAIAHRQEIGKCIEKTEILQSKARIMGLDLEAKGQEETRLQNLLRDATRGHEVTSRKQKARIDALDKELSDLRQEASEERIHTQKAFDSERKSVLELETQTRRLEEELISAGQIRKEIQNASNSRVSQLESKLHELEEQTMLQLQSLREAQEANQELQHVKADNSQLRDKVEELSQRLQMMEITSAHEKEYQQTVKAFLDHVRAQLSREIEDKRARENWDSLYGEVSAEKSAVEGLQSELTLKLSNIDLELEWYKLAYEDLFAKQEQRDKIVKSYSNYAII